MLVQAVGRDHYLDACAFARRDAEREDYGRGDPGDNDSSLVAHEISDALWEADAPLEERIATFFEIYDEMPSYGFVMYASHEYGEWPLTARRQFWDGVRKRLATSDRALGRPLAYSLWCDWFEHGEYTAEAWEALTAPDTPVPVLEHVLIASGPVPWPDKTRLYNRLITDVRWHYYIFRSLLHSAFDVYGKFDRNEAAGWLTRLSIPSSTEHLSELQRRLRGS
jgi:hypothetical protein